MQNILKLDKILHHIMNKLVNLPKKAAYWYAKYSQTALRREQILFLYYSLGSLSGGFKAIPELFQTACEAELGNRLLLEIEALRAEDDETGPAIYNCSFDDADLKKIESIFIKAAT